MTVLGPLIKNFSVCQTKKYHYFIVNIIRGYTISEATGNVHERENEMFLGFPLSGIEAHINIDILARMLAY